MMLVRLGMWVPAFDVYSESQIYLNHFLHEYSFRSYLYCYILDLDLCIVIKLYILFLHFVLRVLQALRLC